jgi:plastocyanin
MKGAIGMRTWYQRLLPLAVGAVLLAGCASGQADEPPTGAAAKGVNEVAAKDVKFTPPIVEVPAGTAVTWKFQDRGVPHDVKGDGFNSGKPRSSGSFTHTFTTPGSYDYVCTLHPQMTGRVMVTPSQ